MKEFIKPIQHHILTFIKYLLIFLGIVFIGFHLLVIGYLYATT